MNRLEMLEFMDKILFNTPIYMKVSKFNECFKYNPKTKIVVYLDLTSHRGENKELLTIEEAYEKYPNNLASLYIDSNCKFAVSYRYLKIGNYYFWINYISKNDWRSNVGEDIQISINSFGDLTNPMYKVVDKKINMPLYAIDFVQDKDNNHYAIDFNIAPGIKGIGIENYLSAKEIVESIKYYIKESQYELYY